MTIIMKIKKLIITILIIAMLKIIKNNILSTVSISK
jgi:hypothetical protein